MSPNENVFFIGIDVGAISSKISLLTHLQNENTLIKIQKSHPGLFEPKFKRIFINDAKMVVVVTRYKRTMGAPLRTTIRLLQEIIERLPDNKLVNLSVTGSNGKLIAAALKLPYQNEFQAIALAMGFLHPDVKTVLEMGGDSSKYILLQRADDTGMTGIVDYEVNGECAAGTGSFIDQQASRLLYRIEEVGDIVRQAGKPASIAGRCSVFAKSDMIHAQQKGYQPPEILRGLCEAVVRNFRGTIVKGKPIVPKIAFIGGVAANEGIVSALRQTIAKDDDIFFVPKLHNWMEAIGTALLSLKKSSNLKVANFKENLQQLIPPAQKFETLKPLKKDNTILLRNQVHPISVKSEKEKIVSFLGIDIGSVTTKLVVIDRAGNVLKGIYTKTKARPIEVVSQGLHEIEREIGDKIEIQGVGTTGSGRELIGELVNADIVKDEITAHKTGALHISKSLNQQKVDTIFDIGGQDSKYISIEEGVVVDFTMNEACAAGTGSFLEEQAEKLDINIKQEFAELAFQAEHPIRLGERCTVFMEKEIIPFLQRGADKKDIIAGLAYSIVTNYLNRVVRGRKIGDVIFFQGGTAYNDAVAAAFSMILKKKIIVPPFNGILGAIGAALLAQENMVRKKTATKFNGFNLNDIHYTLRSFTCKGCTNYCDIQEFNVEGKKTYWGDKCSEKYRKEARVERDPVVEDLIALRERLLLRTIEKTQHVGPTVGIPRALYYYDQLPFWSTYFKHIGYRVILSDETNRKIINDGIETRVAEPCFPLTVAHGHINDLIRKNVDFIFVPNMIDAESKESQVNSFFCPWGQTLCYVIQATPKFIPYREKLLYPTIRFRLGKNSVKQSFQKLAKCLGVSKHKSDSAVGAAYEALYDFQRELIKVGKNEIEQIITQKEKAIVLLGRPYNLYDKMININIPTTLRKQYGINVIPIDFIDTNGIDISDINDNMYWNYGKKIIRTARWTSQFDNFHLIYITNFKCGPDSYIKHYISEAATKPYLTLQFDEHGNDAGIITRCEAYLDSKGFIK